MQKNLLHRWGLTAMINFKNTFSKLSLILYHNLMISQIFGSCFVWWYTKAIITGMPFFNHFFQDSFENFINKRPNKPAELIGLCKCFRVADIPFFSCSFLSTPSPFLFLYFYSIRFFNSVFAAKFVDSKLRAGNKVSAM